MAEANKHYRVRVNIDIIKLAAGIAGSGRRYITVHQLAEMLGISTKTAGRILSRLEYVGLVEKHSRRAYRISRVNL